MSKLFTYNLQDPECVEEWAGALYWAAYEAGVETEDVDSVDKVQYRSIAEKLILILNVKRRNLTKFSIYNPPVPHNTPIEPAQESTIPGYSEYPSTANPETLGPYEERPTEVSSPSAYVYSGFNQP